MGESIIKAQENTEHRPKEEVSLVALRALSPVIAGSTESSRWRLLQTSAARGGILCLVGRVGGVACVDSCQEVRRPFTEYSDGDRFGASVE